MSSAIAILSEGLTRAFGGRRAVDGVSFAVEAGEIFGFLGPNGAGKTTTVRLLTGQIRPTSGRAVVAGCDVVGEHARLKPRIGVVFEEQNLYERFSGRDNLLFSARLYGLDAQRVEEVLELVALRDRAGDRVRQYSNGMRQRLLIGRALLHRPQVVFLDEPTKGLDPGMARELRALIAGLAAQGVTVFLTTHYMEEADQLCGRVAFLNEGRIVALDSPERLKIAYGQRRVQVTLNDGQRLTLSLDSPTDGERLGALASAGQVTTVHSAEATLEEVFIRLTGRSLR